MNYIFLKKKISKKNLGYILSIIFSLSLLLVLTGCAAKAASAVLSNEDQEEMVKDFFQAINDKDAEKAGTLLGSDMVYLEKFSDGTQNKLNSKIEIQDVIEVIIDNDTQLTVTKFDHKNAEALIAQGKVSDFITDHVGIAEGLRFSSEFSFKDGKIQSLIFERNKEDEELFLQKTKGTIGITISDKDSQLIIDECLKGKSADKAGLKTGDRIEAVDGSKVSDYKYGLKEAVYRIRGEAGTNVQLTINRAGEVFDVLVLRSE